MSVQTEKYLYLETFGCQMNASDSEKIAAMLKEIGYLPVADPARADLILLNTCSVRDKAEHKVYSSLGRLRELKRPGSGVILGVGGCVAQQEGERLLRRVPYLDLVFGTHNLHLLPELVLAAERGERRSEVAFLDNQARLDLFPTQASAGGVTAFVTVMQGCDNFCSYCIVPYVRGREISRRSGDVLREVALLAEQGVREVTLLGQNVNSYGAGVPGEMDFTSLLREVSAISGIERIRFTTSHPKDVSERLLQAFADLPKLCGHMHLPAQSGSDRILARMNRGYTRGGYLAKVAALRQARPGIFITGDIIVGFPGETEEDFAETLSLMDEVGYADLFSFVYSVRPGTKAAEEPDDVARKVKRGRLDLLQERQRAATLEVHRGYLGTVQQVLVEGESRKGGQITGRTDGNRVVNFPGDGVPAGSLVQVRITEAHPNTLRGRLLREEQECISK